MGNKLLFVIQAQAYDSCIFYSAGHSPTTKVVFVPLPAVRLCRQNHRSEYLKLKHSDSHTTNNPRSSLQAHAAELESTWECVWLGELLEGCTSLIEMGIKVERQYCYNTKSSSTLNRAY